MSYQLSALISPFDVVEGGPRAVHIGSHAFGQAPFNGNGDTKVVMVLLLVAAYMNLFLNLIRVPDRRKVLEASQ